MKKHITLAVAAMLTFPMVAQANRTATDPSANTATVGSCAAGLVGASKADGSCAFAPLELHENERQPDVAIVSGEIQDEPETPPQSKVEDFSTDPSDESLSGGSEDAGDQNTNSNNSQGDDNADQGADNEAGAPGGSDAETGNNGNGQGNGGGDGSNGQGQGGGKGKFKSK